MNTDYTSCYSDRYKNIIKNVKFLASTFQSVSCFSVQYTVPDSTHGSGGSVFSS